MRNNFLMNTESAFILLEEVVAKPDKHNRVDQADFAGSGDRTASNMSHADKIAQTQKLLDRAIASAWYTVKSDRRPPKLTPIRWVWRLAAFYHLCHSTPQLMEAAAQRFALADRKSLAQWAVKKAREEAGHDQLALLDIESMGYKAEAVVEALFPPAAKNLVDHFTTSVHNSDPIDCVGYSYTAERLGICRGLEYIQRIEALLPQGKNATRCLRIHSAVGTDVEHVEKAVEMIAELTLEEQIRVAIACYKAALLRFSPPQEDYISDEEIQNVLKPLKRLEPINNHA
jgi:pyrroloquinoline quinone (PQQ) biosynthesis protein C